MISMSRFLMKKDGTPYSNCYCVHPELIENYEEAINDTENLWVCHHRLEQVFSLEELKLADWYYDRKPEELIFLKREYHDGNPDLHIGIRRNNKAKIGRKQRKCSAESRARMSQAQRLLSSRPDYINPLLGTHWYTNDITNIKSHECPDGFHKGRTILNK